MVSSYFCGGTFLYVSVKRRKKRACQSRQAHRLVLSRVMRKYNSVTYEVGKAKAEQASGMFGLTAE